MSVPPLPAKFAYTLREFYDLGGPCPVKSYALAAAGEITLTKHGRLTVILYDEIKRYFKSLPTFSEATKRDVEPMIRRTADGKSGRRPGRKPRKVA